MKKLLLIAALLLSVVVTSSAQISGTNTVNYNSNGEYFYANAYITDGNLLLVSVDTNLGSCTYSLGFRDSSNMTYGYYSYGIGTRIDFVSPSGRIVGLCEIKFSSGITAQVWIDLPCCYE